MWCVARFGISHYLALAWPFKRMRMHANAFFYLHVVFISLHELAWHSNWSIGLLMSNVWMPFKRVWRLNVASWFHSIMTIAMQCHPSLYYVRYIGTLLFAVQVNVFISLLWFIFVYYLFLVMQRIANTVRLLKL